LHVQFLSLKQQPSGNKKGAFCFSSLLGRSCIIAPS
jgi:hypothetical protein